MRVFLDKYKKYVRLVTERARLARSEPEILGMKICISDALLRTIAKYELRMKEDEITDKMIKKHLQGFLSPERFFVPG